MFAALHLYCKNWTKKRLPWKNKGFPDLPAMEYRVLDGAHPWQAYKKAGRHEIIVIIMILNGVNPLLYAAKMAKRLGIPRKTLCDHSAEMLQLAFPLNRVPEENQALFSIHF